MSKQRISTAALPPGDSTMLETSTSVIKKSLPLLCFLGFVGIYAGGFYVAVSGICSVFLLIWVFFIQKEKLTFVLNPFSAAILCCFVFYCITPLWAADRGMALFGIVRFLPVVLFLLLFMQKKYDFDAVLQCSCAVAVGMTILSLPGMYIPALKDLFSVAGRLSGTFGYPNTYAAFLTLCLIYQATKDKSCKLDLLINTILCVGLLASGSRGAFIIAAFVLLLCLCVFRKRALAALLPLLICTLGAYLLSFLDVGSEADRYLSASSTSGTFLARLLYYKDALRECLSHPFGLGYWGYRATVSSFQTGRYAVSFVHNDLLQLLLEIGWLPTLGLLCATLWLFWKQNARKRLLMIAFLGHSMIDFDGQFLMMWLILIALSDVETGKNVKARVGKTIACAMVPVCIWFSAADLLYRGGHTTLCTKIDPWHTEAQLELLTRAKTADEMQQIAEDIVELNPNSSLAYSALAEVAYSQGDLEKLIEYKNRTLDLAPYELAEYINFLDKLFAFYNRYAEYGDISGAQRCIDEMRKICHRIDAVKKKTDALAHESGDDQSMELPEEYRQVLLDLD